ncbi:MAG: glycosyltransferase [Prevotella sp.]|nr:glycosyltransferase [Prevotella sp.]
MTGLSILIPTFNDECLTLVRALQEQCAVLSDGDTAIDGLSYEIIVADDGSTDDAVRAHNSAIASCPHCKYIQRGVNAGRAAIRNFLAQQASYDELLFIDSDMTVIRKDYIFKYVSAMATDTVVYGGYDVPEQSALKHNLRYRYERSCREAHTAEKRRESPYLDFHTSNFMIPRTTMLANPLDEQFRHYGYEDVAFGRCLQEKGIIIKHIDNPLGFCRFEDNEKFVEKTEEAIRTLVEFSGQLYNYSRLLQTAERMSRLHVAGLFKLLMTPFEKPMRKALVKKNIPLAVLNIYKLTYLLKQLQNS